MPALSTSLTNETESHPLDLMEQVMGLYEWEFERLGPSEMAAQAPGQWCDYSLYFTWSDELSALHLNCIMDLRSPAKRRPAVHELVSLANNRLWIGHFAVDPDTGTPSYRHTLLLRGVQTLPGESMEDLVEIAMSECERFYPAFQFALWGGKTPQEAIDAAMLDCVGDA
ncbi:MULTISPECIES: type III secretion system chaperone family protein [Gluconobacter]|uniref:YbjN domain-containing protein n=1 Tax=Gluconobacter cadivus TaxID=2728101 RepID=A0ABR9YX69_9PROT|nr:MULTISPECIES: YbjN domain-containing protein [Gluconobacter]MBF0889151.1 YbjN domain-containing protein [Gluconobacter cadivus]MBS1061254.1 YbjN domain-containing protein [Gluconobacter sp. Dm-44]MBS1075931.1 YbjN domain-containing protein [Gluconobacter sp. Dm-73]